MNAPKNHLAKVLWRGGQRSFVPDYFDVTGAIEKSKVRILMANAPELFSMHIFF